MREKHSNNKAASVMEPASLLQKCWLMPLRSVWNTVKHNPLFPLIFKLSHINFYHPAHSLLILCRCLPRGGLWGLFPFQLLKLRVS